MLALDVGQRHARRQPAGAVDLDAVGKDHNAHAGPFDAIVAVAYRVADRLTDGFVRVLGHFPAAKADDLGRQAGVATNELLGCINHFRQGATQIGAVNEMKWVVDVP